MKEPWQLWQEIYLYKTTSTGRGSTAEILYTALLDACTVLTWQSKSWKFRVPFCQQKAENTVSFSMWLPQTCNKFIHSESRACAALAAIKLQWFFSLKGSEAGWVPNMCLWKVRLHFGGLPMKIKERNLLPCKVCNSLPPYIRRAVRTCGKKVRHESESERTLVTHKEAPWEDRSWRPTPRGEKEGRSQSV